MPLSPEQLIELGQETVRKQAQAIVGLEGQIGGSFAAAVKAILGARGHTILCGMGKSGHIGNKIAATFASTGTPSFFIHPAEAFHGDLGMITSEDVIILISYSGETDEVIKLIPSLRSFGVTIIAIVGESQSTLAKHADLILTMTVKSEVCRNNLAPTNSTMTTLALGDALAVALMEEREFEAIDFARFHPGGSLGKRLLTRVSDLMHTQSLPLVLPGTPMLETIAVMNEGRLGVAVVAEEGVVYGIITDGDLRRAIASGADLRSQTCDSIMTTTPLSIDAESRFADAEAIMLERKINTLLVIDDKGLLTGVLQLYDL